ncbi:MAG: hypothetical protein VX615_05215 [Planctomycetota bacterium]|nr:hypothetical protein [Planctomycetota bacterium]
MPAPLIALIVSLCATSICCAQSRQVPAPKQSIPIAIHSATVHTLAGEKIEDGYVIITDGVIQRVGHGFPPIADDVHFVDAEGQHLYPGLVSIGTQLGLLETGATDVTHDHNELGSMTPEVKAVIAVNPDSDHLPVTRDTGILTAIIFPSGGRVPGRSSAIRLDGWTNEDLTILDDAGLVIDWPNNVRRSSRGGPFGSGESAEDSSTDELDDLIEQARDWKQAYDAGERDFDLAMNAMQKVLNGEVPAYIKAQTIQQINTSVAWAKRHDLKPIIVGGANAPECAELLINENVPVVCNGIMALPSRRDLPFDQQFTLPKRLHDSGITFCIATGASGAHERRLPFHAGKAVAYGLDEDIAIESITKHAASICGLGESHGTIEQGKSATLILTDGSPIDIRTNVNRAWIDGREISLESRHTELNDKYREKYNQLGR